MWSILKKMREKRHNVNYFSKLGSRFLKRDNLPNKNLNY